MSASSWKEVAVKDVCESVVDCVNKTAPVVDYPTPYKMIRTTNVKNGVIDINTVRYVEKETFEKWTRRSIPKAGDVILTREAPLGEVGMMPDNTENIFLGQRLMQYRADPKKLNPHFLLYSMQESFMQGQIRAAGSGSTVEHMRVGDAENIKIRLPDIEKQNDIASVLSAYDALILNNNRRIAILENMAQSLYREWFVNFRFPGHENCKFVDSPLGKVPEGWEVKTVEQLISRRQVGKKYDNKTVNAIGNVPVLDQGKSGIIGYHNDEPGFIASLDDPVIIFANHTCYQRLIQFPFSAIQNVLPFKPVDGEYGRDIYWLHHVTKDVIQFNDYKGHWPEFMAKRIILPPKLLCGQFGSFAIDIYKIIFKLNVSIKNLKEQRDILLPRLVSGQLEIKE